LFAASRVLARVEKEKTPLSIAARGECLPQWQQTPHPEQFEFLGEGK
jgi:hypothetical protein